MPCAFTILRALFLALMIPLASAQPPASAAPKPAFFHQFYAGRLAHNHAFRLDLKYMDGWLRGELRYTHKPQIIYLQGHLMPDGSFAMEQWDQYYTRVLGGVAGTIAGKKIAGVWTSADGGSIQDFVADQTAEILIGSQKDILTRAIGDYALKAISGSDQERRRWASWKSGTEWHANATNTHSLVREMAAVTLTPTDIALLESMTIKVDASLTMRVLAGGQTIVAVPYRDGVTMRMKDAHGKRSEHIMSPHISLNPEQIYLFTETGVDYARAMSASFFATSQGALTIKYSMLEDNFDIGLSDDCCNSRYRFERVIP